MISLITFVSPPSRCGYLPDQNWSLRYHVVSELTSEELGERLASGWRRFGQSLFQPACTGCTACQPMRVDVARFRPSATQKRVWKQNAGEVRLEIGPPQVSPDRLELYDLFHAFQADFKGWPERGPESADDYCETFVNNPLPVEEWCYYLGDRLIGVGYVDVVPRAYSAIYFYYDPNERGRSLGVFNVLSILDRAATRNLPYVYLGYYVEGCRSLEYKAKYRPNEVLGPDGEWKPFRDE